MTEEEPFTDDRDGPRPLELDDPNVMSTLDMPPSADAQRAHVAFIRRHLQERSRQDQPPSQGD